MKKVILIILTFISTTILAQKNLKESVTLEKLPVIDGDVSDWSCDWWIDPDGKFFYNVTNDEENLYVRLKIADDLTQQKIGLFGLSVKLNPSGKRKGKLGLKYPIGKDASEFKKKEPEETDNSLDQKSKAQLKKELLGDVDVVELIGLSKENIVASRLGLANGIEAMVIALEDGAYTYEAKIPFKAFRINKKEVKVLGVEFETGRLNMATKNNNVAANQGTTPGFGGSSPGATYGAGGYRIPRYYYNSMGGSNYQYNVFATPGYFFVAVKLK